MTVTVLYYNRRDELLCCAVLCCAVLCCAGCTVTLDGPLSMRCSVSSIHWRRTAANYSPSASVNRNQGCINAFFSCACAHCKNLSAWANNINSTASILQSQLSNFCLWVSSAAPGCRLRRLPSWSLKIINFSFLSLSQRVNTQQLRSIQPNSASMRLSLRGLTHLGCDYQGWRQSWEILCKERGHQGVLGIVVGTRQVLLVKPEYIILALWGTTGVIVIIIINSHSSSWWARYVRVKSCLSKAVCLAHTAITAQRRLLVCIVSVM